MSQKLTNIDNSFQELSKELDYERKTTLLPNTECNLNFFISVRMS